MTTVLYNRGAIARAAIRSVDRNINPTLIYVPAVRALMPKTEELMAQDFKGEELKNALLVHMETAGYQEDLSTEYRSRASGSSLILSA